MLFPDDVFRVGNATGHKLAAVRPTEVDTVVVNGVMMIIANGKGVSLYTLTKIIEKGLTGYAWKFQKYATVIPGLKLVSDEPEHFMLAPAHNMPVAKYKGLLEEMGLRCCKYCRVKEGGIVVMGG